MISDKKNTFYNKKKHSNQNKVLLHKTFLKIPSLTLRSEIDQYKIIQSSPYIIIKPKGGYCWLGGGGNRINQGEYCWLGGGGNRVNQMIKEVQD